MESGFYSSEDENRIFVVFGGKIGVGLARNEVEKQIGICFQELDNNHEIGERKPEKFNKEKPTIYLLFEDVKSIDVLIKDLSEAKKQLDELCTNQTN